LQKVVDRSATPPYMAPHRRGAAANLDGFALSVASKDGQRSPGIVIGEPWLSASFVEWLFDIVGLDEGTCGRRRPVRGSSGSGYRFKYADA
jgi:hypothetical protein